MAVLSVIAFHYGFLPNGFLGVDVFFVISGYLITGIIYGDFVNGHFSLASFYLRRTRRIIPITIFISLVSLLFGILTMLPDDLENLAQSVIATNLFGNNILQAMTTKNYWDIVNEYKPLMHTWSLSIEEQYYVLYPLLFIILRNKLKKFLLPLLTALTFGSLTLLFSSYEDYQKFYFLPFRFFELATGGLAAIYFRGRLISHRMSFVFILALIVCLLFPMRPASPELMLVAVVGLTLGVLMSDNSRVKISSSILEYPIVVAIGKISFSLFVASGNAGFYALLLGPGVAGKTLRISNFADRCPFGFELQIYRTAVSGPEKDWHGQFPAERFLCVSGDECSSVLCLPNGRRTQRCSGIRNKRITSRRT
jgi:peptidoglycan/LPS O-acetylase OafA/YrhL